MKYSFRFFNLKEPVAKKLADDLGKYDPTMKKSRHSPPKTPYAISLRLNKRADAKFLAKIMQKHKIKSNKTDVFASLLAVKDTAIIGLPEYVNEVIHATHCNVTFSYTYVG